MAQLRLLHTPSYCLWTLCAVIYLIAILPVTASKPDRCNISKCVSPQYVDASNNNDKHNLCRLLKPALDCMERDLASCRETLVTGGSHSYELYVKELNTLQRKYANTCHKMVTNCHGLSQCLRPGLLNANHDKDYEQLCKHGPEAIKCVKVVLNRCEKDIGYRDANMEMLGNYIDKMKQKVTAYCDATSSLIGNTSLLVTLSMVLVQKVLQYFSTRPGTS